MTTPYSQTDPRWKDETYDSTTYTIGKKGCALTALAMALTVAGYPVTPDSLNAFMNANRGFDSASVNWRQTVPAFTGLSQSWNILTPNEDRAALGASVCSGKPVVVYVPSLVSKLPNGKPGPHFVFVTGAPRDATDSTPLDQFTIVDPGGGASTLAPYGSFSLRGYPMSTGQAQPAPVAWSARAAADTGS